MSENKFDARKTGDQKFRDWGGDHIAVFKGRCPISGHAMYTEKDVLADGTTSAEYYPDMRWTGGEWHAATALVATDYGYEGEDFVFCAGCANDQRRYNLALEMAKKIWTLPDLSNPVWDGIENDLTPEQ